MVGGPSKGTQQITFEAVRDSTAMSSSSSSRVGGGTVTTSSSAYANTDVGPKQVSERINREVRAGYIRVDEIKVDNWIFIMGGWMLIVRAKAIGTLEPGPEGANR